MYSAHRAAYMYIKYTTAAEEDKARGGEENVASLLPASERQVEGGKMK